MKSVLKIDPEAQYNLAYLHERGMGEISTPLIAKHWYKVAANNGNSAAQNKLAHIYYKQKKYQKAFQLFQNASLDHKGAKYNLGYMYLCGISVEKDYKKALVLFEAVIDRKDPSPLINIGYMHYYGLGTLKNNRQAISYFTRALCLGSQNKLAKKVIHEFFSCDLNNSPLTQPQFLDYKGRNEIKYNLVTLRDYYSYFEGFAGGGYKEGYTKNSYLCIISQDIINLCKVYSLLLNQIYEPGFMLNCLELKPSPKNISKDEITSKSSVVNACLKLRDDIGPCINLIISDEITILHSRELYCKISELSSAYKASINIVNEILQDKGSKEDINNKIKGILSGLIYANPSLYVFFKAYIAPYYDLRIELRTHEILWKIFTKLNKHVKKIESHLEFSQEINSLILDEIKESLGYRNQLFIKKVW